MGAYIYRTHISGNYFVDVGDSHPEENPESVMVWRFGKIVADTNLSSFGAWLFNHQDVSSLLNQGFHRSRELFDLMNLKTVSQDQQVFQDNTELWLPNAQLMATRLSNGMFVAAHGGNNGESHNHNDVGDFLFMLMAIRLSLMLAQVLTLQKLFRENVMIFGSIRLLIITCQP